MEASRLGFYQQRVRGCAGGGGGGGESKKDVGVGMEAGVGGEKGELTRTACNFEWSAFAGERPACFFAFTAARPAGNRRGGRWQEVPPSRLFFDSPQKTSFP